MRWILVHMIEETARHCGHADLIRESLDGESATSDDEGAWLLAGSALSPGAPSRPSASSRSEPRLVEHGTPSCSAFWSFDPGMAPATTAEVFFETEPVTLPPRVSIAALASSRLKPSSVPVTTTVTPASRSLAGPPSGSGSASRTPAASSLATSRRLSSIRRPLPHRTGDLRTDAVDGGDLVLRRLHQPRQRAERAGPATGPRCRRRAGSRARSAAGRAAGPWRRRSPPAGCRPRSRPSLRGRAAPRHRA